MEADEIFRLYFTGNWRPLPMLLEERMSQSAAAGDIAGLSRALSYYGIVHLIWSNEYYISTVYQQIRAEYREAGDDPRRKASYARFLALYHAFDGTAALAAQYYREAGQAYRETDWIWDEACVLLESVYWFSLANPAVLPPYSAVGRLEVLNNSLAGCFNHELRFIHSFLDQPEFPFYLSLLRQPAFDHYELSIMAFIYISFLALRQQLASAEPCALTPAPSPIGSDSRFKEWPDCPLIQLLQGMINASGRIAAAANRPDLTAANGFLSSLKANGELFRHPWYQTQIHQLGEPFHDNAKTQFFGKTDHPSPETAPDAPESPGLSAVLFGKSQIGFQNRMVNLADLPAKTGAALLICLLSRPNFQVHKDALVELFFPNGEPAKSFNRLYVNIHRFNQTLRNCCGLPEGQGFILIKQGIVTINAALFEEADTQKFRKILAVANQLWGTRTNTDQEAAVEMIHTAVRLFSPDIAPGFYYLDWLEDYRLELKNMQIKAIHKLFQYYRARQNSAACSEAFYNIIELDPLNEDYLQEFLDYLLNDGRRVEAMNLYKQYEKRLRKELGLTPPPRVKSLMARAGGV